MPERQGADGSSWGASRPYTLLTECRIRFSRRGAGRRDLFNQGSGLLCQASPPCLVHEPVVGSVLSKLRGAHGEAAGR